jgi:hypothetical protein
MQGIVLKERPGMFDCRPIVALALQQRDQRLQRTNILAAQPFSFGYDPVVVATG